jgi:iron complex outermembrane recepter protein
VICAYGWLYSKTPERRFPNSRCESLEFRRCVSGKNYPPMNMPLTGAPLWRRLVLCIVVFVGCVAISRAQPSATGSIQGRVLNPDTNEYVRNAEVRLEGTNRVTYTGGDGTFRFTNVPAGPAAVTITYTGYNPVRETFTVTAGQPVVREISVTSTARAAPAPGDGVVRLQAFTVSTEREGNAKAIMDQRRNMDITTSVSSDIFGDVTDGNVGEFLKYLPGVDLDYVESEARGPRLGGMDSQYVGVSFDGVRTASADANRGGGENSRATSFEGFAITSIESIEISRTTSAESPADSPAGTINMKTKRAFNYKGRSINYNASLNFNAEEFTLSKRWGPDENKNYKWLPNLTLQYADVFMNRRLGVLLGVSRANSYTEQYDINMDYNRSPITTAGANNYDPRPMVLRQLNFKDGPKLIQKDALTLTADFKATDRLVFSFTGIYTFTEGEFWNRNFTWIAAANNNNANRGRSRVGGDGITTVIATPSSSNPEARLDNGGGSSSKLTYTRTFAPRFEYTLDNWVFDGVASYSKSINNYEALEYGFSEIDGGSIASGWTATRPHKDSWEWTIRQTSGPDWYDLGNFGPSPTASAASRARSAGTMVENSGRTWTTEIYNAQLNARWALPFLRAFPTAVKFGGQWNEEARLVSHMDDWFIWAYNGPGGNTTRVNPTTLANENVTYGSWDNLGFVAPHEFDLGTTNGLTVFNISGTQGMPPRADRNRIGNLFTTNPGLFVHTATPDNYYNNFVVRPRNFRQTVTAAYIQADTRLTEKIQLRAGIRMENTLNRFKEINPRLAADVIAAGYPVNNAGRATTFEGIDYQFLSQPRVIRESEYHNYFPSLMAKYRITPALEWQAGFNKAISRPPLDDLTGVWQIDEVNERVTATNGELLPEHSKNYQTRLAYYFGGRAPGQFSVALSQNNIRNLRQSFDFTPEEFGVTDSAYATYTFRSRSNSAETRRFRNMEIVYNQTLGFLPEMFRGTNVNLTYTRSYGNQRRNNLAPHRLTARLGYAYRRFNGTIGMVYRDASPAGNYGNYKDALTQFDTSLNFKVTRWLSLYVQGRNITGKPVKWYWSPPGVDEGVDAHLRQIQEYGANWVFGVKGVF